MVSRMVKKRRDTGAPIFLAKSVYTSFSLINAAPMRYLYFHNSNIVGQNVKGFSTVESIFGRPLRVALETWYPLEGRSFSSSFAFDGEKLDEGDL